jgi:ABC transporter substrate binding protein
VIGFLSSVSARAVDRPVVAFRQGLKEVGYVEDQNVAIEYCWAEGQDDRLPELCSELIRKNVAVIVATGGGASAAAAKAATRSIPIVFSTAADSVKLGLVPSLNRPGGNMTGVYGGQACRSARCAADQIRASHQPQHRKGPRIGTPCTAPGTRRRGHRVRRREFITLLSGVAT